MPVNLNTVSDGVATAVCTTGVWAGADDAGPDLAAATGDDIARADSAGVGAMGEGVTDGTMVAMLVAAIDAAGLGEVSGAA